MRYHHISNVRFHNALTVRATAIQKVFAFVRCDASNAQETIQPSIVHAEKNPRTLNACEANKGYMIYKDLQRNFFSTLGRKVVTSKPQLRIEPASIQIRHVVFIFSQNIDILLVSETYLTNKNYCRIPEYTLYHTMH